MSINYSSHDEVVPAKLLLCALQFLDLADPCLKGHSGDRDQSSKSSGKRQKGWHWTKSDEQRFYGETKGGSCRGVPDPGGIGRLKAVI